MKSTTEAGPGLVFGPAMLLWFVAIGGLGSAGYVYFSSLVASNDLLVTPLALALYFAAYLLMVTVLRFADCFQHTYEAYPIDDDTPLPPELIRDKEYEQANTFTNVVGLHSFWGNLLWLNFGFHNAHHERPIVPWHRLPALHREL